MYIYIRATGFGDAFCKHGSPRVIWRLFAAFGHQLMHPDAHLEFLASTKQVSDLKNINRGPFPSILLTSLSVN